MITLTELNGGWVRRMDESNKLYLKVPMKKERNSSVEVLRCFLMFCVVFGHVNGGLFWDRPIAPVLGNLTAFAVDAFVFISGWYSVRFSWKKFGGFLWQGLYSGICVWLISLLFCDRVIFKFFMGWFGNSYLGLLVLTPFINEGFDAVWARLRNAALGAYLAYAVLVIVSWMHNGFPRVFLGIPGWTSHSFNTLLFMYLTGRVLSRIKDDRWFLRIWNSRSLLVICFVMLQLLVIGWLSVGRLLKDNELWGFLYLIKPCDNQSPFIICSGIIIFLIFYRIRFCGVVARFCLFAGPSTFMIYLIHNKEHLVYDPIFSSMKLFFCGHDPGMLRLAAGNLLVAAIVFVVCLLMDMPRRYILNKFFDRVK